MDSQRIIWARSLHSVSDVNLWGNIMLGTKVIKHSRLLAYNGVGFFKLPGQMVALRPAVVLSTRKASTTSRLWLPRLSEVSLCKYSIYLVSAWSILLLNEWNVKMLLVLKVTSITALKIGISFVLSYLLAVHCNISCLLLHIQVNILIICMCTYSLFALTWLNLLDCW